MQFTPTELSIIASVVQYEQATGRELPHQSFYKAIAALATAHRLGFSWLELVGLFQ